MTENHDKEIQRILKKRYIKHTQEIDLTQIAELEKYTEECCQRLFKFRNWTSIRVITLNDNNYSSKIVKILSEFKWPHLTQLHLHRNSITCEGVKHLCDIPLTKLIYLDLSFCKIKEEGMNTLIKKLECSEIQQIDLHGNQISWKGFKNILKVPQSKFQHIKCLNLNQNRVGNKGIKYLIKLSLPALNSLHLNSCEVSNAGIKQIHKGDWPVLQKLQITQQIQFVICLGADNGKATQTIQTVDKYTDPQIAQKPKKNKSMYDNNYFIMLMQLVLAEFTSLNLERLSYLQPRYGQLKKMVDQIIKKKAIRCLL